MTRQFLVPIELPGNPTSSHQAATKQYVDTTITTATSGRSGGTTGAVGTVTSGTTELTVTTMTVPIMSLPGRLHVSGSFGCQLSVSGDRFIGRLRGDGVEFLQCRGLADMGAATLPTFCPDGSFPISGSAAVTLTFTVQRLSGTGTLTIADSVLSHLHWTFVAT